MAPTFYGVLGVGPDADREAIELGYRERVTEVHPDVNDDPDADAQFKRLTTARDTLLDADERSRYDRLGHASYVRHHVSCSAWDDTVSGRNEREMEGDTESSDRGRREGGQRRSRSRDWNTGRRRGTRRDTSGSSPGPTSGGRKQRRDRYGTARSTGGSTGSGDGRSTGWSSTTDGRRGRSNAGASGGADATYASSSFWESQRVGERVGARDRTGDPLAVRVLRAVQALGIWAFIHVAFLVTAVGTSWYVYAVVLDASTASLPLLVVLVGEVVLAAVLSSIHVATRVYR